MDEKQQEWNRLYNGFLVGMKCVAVRSEPDEYGGEPWPVLVFQNADGRPVSIGGELYGGIEVMVSRDPEGNGPGFLMGLPDVPDDKNPHLPA